MGRKRVVELVRAKLDTTARGWTDFSKSKPTIHITVPASVLRQFRADWEAAQRRGLTREEFIAERARQTMAEPARKSLRSAVHDGDFLICPVCLTIQPADKRLRVATCTCCGHAFSRMQGVALARIGFDVAYYGWFYRAAHAARPKRAFLLPDPGPFLWALGSFIALTAVSGLTWDAIKIVAERLYARYKTQGSAMMPLTDAEAMQELRTLHQWAVKYLGGKLPVGQLKRLIVESIEVNQGHGDERRILQTRLRIAKPARSRRKPRSKRKRPAKRRAPGR